MGEYKLKKKIDKFILDTLKERTNLLSTIIKIILYVLELIIKMRIFQLKMLVNFIVYQRFH